jgi:NADH-quinone oxidoreductase subunit J
VAFFVAVALACEVGVMFWYVRQLPSAGLLTPPAPADKLPPNSEQFAKVLFSDYVLPFEIASILLLVAMIGAVVMAKKRT